VLIPYAPDWRWILDGHNSSWYLSLLLWRQPESGPWVTVLGKVAETLRTKRKMLRQR
jgi:hypothetical protein